jgi:hypothetical protein
MVLVPQGLFGDILRKVSPFVGNMVGGRAGNVISQVGQAAGSILPFSAGPQMGQQGQQQGQEPMVLVPQGLIGDLISKFAPMLPFSAGPQMGQQQGLDPQFMARPVQNFGLWNYTSPHAQPGGITAPSQLPF